MTSHDMIVIGASAGGLEAIQSVVSSLPKDLPASLHIVLHSRPHKKSLFPSILQKDSKLPVVAPDDKTPIQHGNVYVAPPDHHMLIERDNMRIVHGPKENRHRPAVDPLFRSAAWWCGPRVVGVVLSGMLDDGAAGLWAVKSCGGTAVVQDPADAKFPDMPSNAMVHVPVDYKLPAHEIGEMLVKLAHSPVTSAEQHVVPDRLETEIGFAMMNKDIDNTGVFGPPSAFTCPSCNGALWELHEGGQLRYRCHTGHAFSSESLLEEQGETIEEALYSAMRLMTEKSKMLRRIAETYVTNLPTIQSKYSGEANRLEEQIEVLRRLLMMPPDWEASH